MARIEFIAGVPEEVDEIRIRQGRESGKRIVLFVFRRVNAMGGLRSFAANSIECLRLIDEEGDIAVYPRKSEFFYKNDDDLAKLEFTFELVGSEQWGRVKRFMDRYAESNGMGFENRDTSTAPKPVTAPTAERQTPDPQA